MALDFNIMTTSIDMVVRRLKQAGMKEIRKTAHGTLFQLPHDLVRDRNYSRWQISQTPSDRNACRAAIRDLFKVMKDLPGFMGCHMKEETEVIKHILLNTDPETEPSAPVQSTNEGIMDEAPKQVELLSEKLDITKGIIDITEITELLNNESVVNPFHALFRAELMKYNVEAMRLKKSIETDVAEMSRIKKRVETAEDTLNKFSQWMEQATTVLVNYKDAAPLATMETTPIKEIQKGLEEILKPVVLPTTVDKERPTLAKILISNMKPSVIYDSFDLHTLAKAQLKTKNLSLARVRELASNATKQGLLVKHGRKRPCQYSLPG